MIPLDTEQFDAKYESPTARPIKELWKAYEAGDDIDASLPFYCSDDITLVDVWCPTKGCHCAYYRVTDEDRAHRDFAGMPADHDVMCRSCATSANLEDQMESYSAEER